MPKSNKKARVRWQNKIELFAVKMKMFANKYVLLIVIFRLYIVISLLFAALFACC